MWLHTGRLPHVLEPRRYHDRETYARELAALFAPSWHLVATRDRLRAPGDFITLELLGEPVLVRNCDGEIRAFQNVCAHRHARLTSLPCGSASRIRCQYHGWEYDADGKTCRVPDAPSFVPIRRRGESIRRFRAATAGQLVFVCLREDSPDLHAALGEVTWTLLEDTFGDDWAEVGTWMVDHAANWKIPVENSLESYHVPRVHPKTFKKLSHARDATHTLEPKFNALESAAPPAGALMKWISEQLRERPRRKYEHHHAYPSLMIARTDISSVAQFVMPTSPTTSRSLAFCFAHRSDRPSLARRALEPLVQRAVARYTHEVLREDNEIFASVQRGLLASRHEGVLGAREERVHAFQEYVARALP